MDRRRLLLSAALLSAAPALGREGAAALAAALEGPRRHAIMRHALAPGTGDPPGFALDDPSSQRRLSDAGRAQARAIGAALAAAGARFDAVLTSRWDRCRETAALLGLGPVEAEPALDSFFGDRSRGPAQTEAVRGRLMAAPPEACAMLVTHQVNVTALTDVFPRSGEVLAIALDPEGAARVVERFLLPA